MALSLTINGIARTLENLEPGSTIRAVVQALDMKPDRVAVEHNGTIVRRPTWDATTVANEDRLEVVHFVGGG